MTRSLLRALALATLAMLALASLPTTAFAQSEEDELPRVVILKVPGGGAKLLADTLYEVETLDLRPESWFAKQAKSRGTSVKRALKKSKYMRRVMSGAKIDVVIRLKSGAGVYDVSFYGWEKGKPFLTFEVPRGEDGLTKEGAEEIRSELVAHLGDRVTFKGDEPEPVEPDPIDAKVDDPVDDPVVSRPDPGSIKRPKDFLWLYGGARLLKNDLTIGGQNGAVLSYQSAFYPGYEIAAEVFPLVFTGEEFTALGFYLNFIQGFDGVSAVDPDGAVTRFDLTHLRVEGGLSYRIDTPRDVAVSGEYVRVRLRATARHESFSIAENGALPSISQTAFVMSGEVVYPLLFPGFALTGGFEFIPISVWGAGLEQFGESAYSYGMGTSLGGLFSVGSGINVSFGYDFGLYRTQFEGVGAAQFEEANAFELIQGVNVGVTYQM